MWLNFTLAAVTPYYYYYTVGDATYVNQNHLMNCSQWRKDLVNRWVFKLRWQYVCYQYARSPSSNCSFGVPQGSVLGPLLFVAYTFPIASIASSYDVRLAQYADDTHIYVALPKSNINTTVHQLQSCLYVLHIWFLQNDLVINPEKSEMVSFCTIQQAHATVLPFTSVDIAGSSVQLTDDLKILGVILTVS